MAGEQFIQCLAGLLQGRKFGLILAMSRDEVAHGLAVAGDRYRGIGFDLVRLVGADCADTDVRRLHFVSLRMCIYVYTLWHGQAWEAIRKSCFDRRAALSGGKRTLLNILK